MSKMDESLKHDLKKAIEVRDSAEVEYILHSNDIDLSKEDPESNLLAYALNRYWFDNREEKAQTGKVVDVMLKHNPRMDGCDYFKETPISVAPDLETAKKLLATLPDDESRRKMIESAHAFKHFRSAEVYDYYLSFKPKLTSLDEKGNLKLVKIDDDERAIAIIDSYLTPEEKAGVFGRKDAWVDVNYFPQSLCYYIKNMPAEYINSLSDEKKTPLDYLNEHIKKIEVDPVPTNNQLKSLETLKDTRSSIVAKGAKTIVGLYEEAAGKNIALSEYIKTSYYTDKDEITSYTDYNEADFNLVPKLPEIECKGPKTIIFVIEHQTLEGKDAHLDHHSATSYVANGVSRKLMGEDSGQEIISLTSTSSNFLSNPSILKTAGKFGTHILISSSIGSREDSPEYAPVSPRGSEYEKDALNNEPTGRIILFNAAGNDGRDNRDLQDKGYKCADTVLIGSAVKAVKGNAVAPYSENGSLLLTPLVAKEGKALNGTSFSAPYASACYGALYRRYGQWDKNPYGLTPEEVKWVMATATSQNISQLSAEQSALKEVITPADFVQRHDGVHFNKKSGFGEFDIAAADKLAACLFKEKEKLKFKADYICSQIAATPCTDVKPQSGKYLCEVKIPESICVDNLVLNLGLKVASTPNQNNLHMADEAEKAKLYDAHIIYHGRKIPCNFSETGISIVHGLLGANIPAGEKIIIETDAPVAEGNIKITGQKLCGQEALYQNAVVALKTQSPQSLCNYDIAFQLRNKYLTKMEEAANKRGIPFEPAYASEQLEKQLDEYTSARIRSSEHDGQYHRIELLNAMLTSAEQGQINIITKTAKQDKAKPVTATLDTIKSTLSSCTLSAVKPAYPVTAYNNELRASTPNSSSRPNS